MINPCILCLIIVCWPCLAERAGSFKEVHEFLIANGHRFVDIIDNTATALGPQLFARDMYFSKRPLQMDTKGDHGGFQVFNFKRETDNFEAFIEVIGSRKIKMSLLLLNEIWLPGKREELIRLLDVLHLRSFFYVAAPSDCHDKLSWYKVISLDKGSIIDTLAFSANTYIVQDVFNLHGLEITSTTSTWAPFYSIEGCNEQGLQCATSFGYLKDMMDIFSARFNFTLISHKNMNNDWGLLPKAGPFNLSGTWGGVMGDVINKKYDMSVTIWMWNIERHELAQFVPVAKTRRMSVMKASKSTDFELFTRVFTDDSWVAISFMAGSILLCMLTLNLLKLEHYSNGEKIMGFTVWIFFVLVQAFYAGALTMFFTSTTTLPFETDRDVIQAYPDWKIWIRSGAEHNIYTHVLKGDTDYIKLWERYREDPNGTIYKSEKEGLEILSKGQNVIMTGESKFIGYLKSNPSDQSLFYFGHSKWQDRSLMFHRNSPLLPMFNQGACYLRERGLVHLLHLKWFGISTEKGGSGLLEKTVLNAGQTVMVFALLLCIFGTSLAVLCVELIFKGVVKKSKNDVWMLRVKPGNRRDVNVEAT